MRIASLRRATMWVLAGSLTACGLAVVLPLLSDFYWAFELPGHFRAQYAALALATTLGFFLLGSWRGGATGAAVFVFLAAPVAWLWVGPGPSRVQAPTLDVLSLNVSFYQRNQDTVRALIDRLDPDLVGLVEVDREWMTQLGSVEQSHPYQVIEPARRRPGVALLSKLPLTATEVRPLANRQLLVAELEFQGRQIVLGVVHTTSPLWGARRAQRDEQLQALTALGEEDAAVILVGDFNTSPWSLAFRRLTRQTGLRNAAAGFGYQPTWPVRWPLFGIPIDHCLVSDSITVREFTTAGPTGSDHLAIHARLSLDPGR